MPFHFYFSYAPADYSDDLRSFFDDLTRMVRTMLLQSGEGQIGFFDSRGTASRWDWPADVAAALQTSNVMIALTSPEYFRSDSSGKEWQIFEMRRHRATRLGSADFSGAIASVIWIPCAEAVPKVVINEYESMVHFDGVYRRNGMLAARKSWARFRDEYVTTLMSLAKHIIRVARTAVLPPLDVLPPFAQVHNAFKPSYQSSVSSTVQVEDVKYKAIVVERHQEMRKTLVDQLRSSNFEVEEFRDAGGLPAHLLEDEPQPGSPDLFVVDLEFEAGENEANKGLDLITKIGRMKPKPAAMAVTAGLSNGNLMEAMKRGAEDVVPKPLDVAKIVSRMKMLASIGRNRRRRPQGQSPLDSKDPLRQVRPIFLSYYTQDNYDTSVAIFLKSNIEARGIPVWYSEEILERGDPNAVKHAFAAIGQANIFLPLITQNYPKSTPCLAELLRFHTLKKGPRVILPVMHGSPKEIQNFEWIQPIIGKHWELSSERFLDDLSALLARIQKTVKSQRTIFPLQAELSGRTEATDSYERKDEEADGTAAFAGAA